MRNENRNARKNVLKVSAAPDLSGIYDVIDGDPFFTGDGELVQPGAWITLEEIDGLRAAGQTVEVIPVGGL